MRLSTWAACHGRSEPSRIPSRERGLLPATYGVEQGLGPQAPETFEDVGRPVEDVPAPSAVPSPGRAPSPAIGTRSTPLPGAIPPCGEGRSSDETRRQRLIAPIPLLRGPVRGDYRRTVTLELTPMFGAVAWDTNGVIPGVELTLLRPFRCLRRRRGTSSNSTDPRTVFSTTGRSSACADRLAARGRRHAVDTSVSPNAQLSGQPAWRRGVQSGRGSTGSSASAESARSGR